jgi:methyl-accepting chemotaxis protein
MQAITDAISKLEGSVNIIEQGTRQQRDGSATATNAIDNLAAASQQLVAQSSSVANEATKLKALSSRLQTEDTALLAYR